MAIVRVGCVEYLNARPLRHGLGSRPDLFSLQYVVPSRVSAWLHGGDVDLALVSSIEYGQRYRVVPGAAVTSSGPVASVAMFSTKPVTAVHIIDLFVDHVGMGIEKYDLCDEWRGLTGLPFVFAFWTGRPDVLTPAHLQAIQASRDAGVAALNDIARAHYPDDDKLACIGGVYLHKNLQYRLDNDCITSLQRFYASAAKLGIIQQAHPI